MKERITVITAATFQCKKCEARVTISQDGNEIEEPKKCKCGSKDFEIVSRKLVDYSPTEDLENWLQKGLVAGRNEGELKEAKESLKLRFTEREIQALLHWFWHSEMMQSIRDEHARVRKRLNEIERRLKAENKE